MMSLDVSIQDFSSSIYLFPIVAVIICAVLVFAFGFKSPSQPPNFSLLNEEQKRVVKRRKKEKEKEKDGGKAKTEQNDHIAVDAKSAKNSSISTSQNDMDLAKEKPKTAKAQNLEASPKKTSKATNATNANTKVQPNKQNVNKENMPKKSLKGTLRDEAVEEDKNAGEWVQLISRRERKNRKKEQKAQGSDERNVKN